MRRAEQAVVVGVHRDCASVRRPSTRRSTPPRCCPAVVAAIQALAGRDRAVHAAAVVADQHVQHGRNERAEHRRGLVLADLLEPGDRLRLRVGDRHRPVMLGRPATRPGGSSSIPACRCPGCCDGRRKEPEVGVGVRWPTTSLRDAEPDAVRDAVAVERVVEPPR